MPFIADANTFVLISGASRGLGAALAREYLACGARVTTVSRRADPELATLAAHQNATLTPIEADLSTVEGTLHAATEVRAVLQSQMPPAGAGVVGLQRYIVINNAGSVEPVNVAQALNDPQAITRAFSLNVTAAMTLTAAVLSSLEGNNRHCRIVNISSGAGRSPTSGWSVYCATKAALDMATRVLNTEQSGSGVRAVALAPGVVDTDMQVTLRDQDTQRFPARERFVSMHAQGKLRSAQAVAESIFKYLNRDDFGTTEIDDIRNYD